MLDKETYKREIIRMWDSLRSEEYKGEESCRGVECKKCALYFFECDSLLMSLLEKGYFDGATGETDVKEYFKNCEILKIVKVDCELGGNENVKRRKV